MEKFEREERYIVIKITDLKYSSVENKLRQVLEEQHIPTRECVVVESDWPEYERVWAAIEARMAGNPDEITTLRQQLRAAEKQRDEFSVLCGMLTENGLDTFNREAILQEQLAQYKADAERLDWLETQGMIGIGHTQWGEYRYYAGDIFTPIREVIDSAIAGKKKDNSE